MNRKQRDQNRKTARNLARILMFLEPFPIKWWPPEQVESRLIRHGVSPKIFHITSDSYPDSLGAKYLQRYYAEQERARIPMQEAFNEAFVQPLLETFFRDIINEHSESNSTTPHRLIKPPVSSEEDQ